MSGPDLSHIPDPVCIRCDRRAADLDYIDSYREPNQSRADYIRAEEGTLNVHNGHFLCDGCYIHAGMPTSPSGWVAP